MIDSRHETGAGPFIEPKVIRRRPPDLVKKITTMNVFEPAIAPSIIADNRNEFEPDPEQPICRFLGRDLRVLVAT